MTHSVRKREFHTHCSLCNHGQEEQRNGSWKYYLQSYSSATEMKRRTPYTVAFLVPKVLIGKRSAMPGSDEKEVSGEDWLLWECCKLEGRALLNLTWLALYDHEMVIVYFTSVLGKHWNIFSVFQLLNSLILRFLFKGTKPLPYIIIQNYSYILHLSFYAFMIFAPERQLSLLKDRIQLHLTSGWVS